MEGVTDTQIQINRHVRVSFAGETMGLTVHLPTVRTIGVTVTPDEARVLRDAIAAWLVHPSREGALQAATEVD